MKMMSPNKTRLALKLADSLLWKLLAYRERDAIWVKNLQEKYGETITKGSSFEGF